MLVSGTQAQGQAGRDFKLTVSLNTAQAQILACTGGRLRPNDRSPNGFSRKRYAVTLLRQENTENVVSDTPRTERRVPKARRSPQN